MAIELQEFMDSLNYDLALEYQAQIQYRNHAPQLSGPFALFETDMIAHADEEAEHASTLNKLIDYLGYIPATDVVPPETSRDTLEMLEQDCKAERTAIDRYKERIQEARELGLVEIEPFLLKILKDETDHYIDLEALLEDEDKPDKE
jgi:bacterioferritin